MPRTWLAGCWRKGARLPGTVKVAPRRLLAKRGHPAPPRQHLGVEASANPPEVGLSQVAQRRMSEGPQAGSKEQKARGSETSPPGNTQGLGGGGGAGHEFRGVGWR